MSINNVSSSPQSIQGAREDITRMIDKMRELSGQAQGSSKVNEGGDFSVLMNQAKSSMDKVNDLQKSSSGLQEAYASGDKSVNLSQVVLASQKSSLAFQALLNVRNKMIEAYKDVMSMPV